MAATALDETLISLTEAEIRAAKAALGRDLDGGESEDEEAARSALEKLRQTEPRGC